MAKEKKKKKEKNKKVKTYDIVKKPAPGRDAREDLLATASTVEGYYLNRFFPFQISRYNPDDLVANKGLSIYKKIAQDEQVKSALFVKKYAVTSAGWEIAPAKDMENDPQMQRVMKFINQSFEGLDGSFDNAIEEILSALDYGYSVTEKVFKVLDSGEFKGHWTIGKLRTRDPETIEFKSDDYGDLLPFGVCQNDRDLPTNKFIIYSYNKRFDNWYGTSDLRSVYRNFFIKDKVLRFLAMALERFGEPIFIFKPNKYITPTQRQRLLDMVDSLQNRTTFILPPDVEHDFFQGNPNVIRAMITTIEMLDRQISTAILVPRGLGISTTDTSGGSFAKSQKEFDTFLWVITQLRKNVEALINDQLVRPIVDLNYFVDDNSYPVFKFRELTDRKRAEMLEQFLEAVKINAVASTEDDRKKIREIIGFPQPEEGVEQELIDKQQSHFKETDIGDNHGRSPVGEGETGNRSITQE